MNQTETQYFETVSSPNAGLITSRRNQKTPVKVVGFKTEVRTEYPINALREAMINALVHRDWF